VVDPPLAIAIVDSFAEPSQISDHDLLHHPLRGRVIRCVLTNVTKVAKLRGFETTCLSFDADGERQLLNDKTNGCNDRYRVSFISSDRNCHVLASWASAQDLTSIKLPARFIAVKNSILILTVHDLSNFIDKRFLQLRIW
jgi:hypothetical protein